MDTHTSTALVLIKDMLLFLEQNSDPIFADGDDCDYFRKKFKKQIAAPTQIAQQAFEAPKALFKAPPIAAPTQIPKVISEPAKAPLPIIPKPIGVASLKTTQTPTSIPVKPLVFSTEWVLTFAKIAPELAILNTPPNDAIAKKITSRWKTKNQTAPITILYSHEIPEQKALLEEITKALDVYFGPAKLVLAEPIEREKQWEALLSMPELKLIICCDYTLWQLGSLMKFYKETPAMKKEISPYCGLQQSEQTGIVALAANELSSPRVSVINRQLGDKPLFLLPDLSLYLKDPLLKRSLWKALCQTLSMPLSYSTKI